MIIIEKAITSNSGENSNFREDYSLFLPQYKFQVNLKKIQQTIKVSLTVIVNWMIADSKKNKVKQKYKLKNQTLGATNKN